MSLDSILRATGKNLFDKSTLTAGTSVVELTQTTNGFTFKTTATSKTMYVGSNVYLSAGTYYCSGTVACSNTNYKGGWAVYDSKTGKFIINASSRGTINDKFTITESKIYQLNFYAPYYAPVGVIMTFGNVQLEKGSTATTYEPYEYLGPKTIKMGSNSKNLIQYPYTETTKTQKGITFTDNGDGTITVNGTSTGIVTFTLGSVSLDNTKSYFLYGKNTSSNLPLRIQIGQAWRADEGNGLAISQASSNTGTIILGVLKGSTFDNVIIYPQLEEGTTATEYELNTGSKEVLKVSYNSKNLFNINNVYSPLNTDTYKISNNTLKVYRNRTSVVGVIYRVPMPVGTQYTLYYDIEYGGTATSVYNYADSKLFNGSLNHVNYTGTVGDTGYLKLEFSRIGGDNDKLGWVTYSNIQVELGNKKTDYVPYFNTTIWTKKA